MIRRRFGLESLRSLAGLMILALCPALVFAQAGTAPTGDPGGFQVDGNLEANSPTPNTSDWIPGPGGSGVGVLDLGGFPLDPTRTFHLIDATDVSDDVFTGATSFLGADPSTQWAWGTIGSTNSNNFQHTMLHVSVDPAGHLWLVWAADRKGTASTTFLDCELLQHTLTKNGNNTFTSTGPNQGRTAGDLLITMQVIDLSTLQAIVVISRWLESSPGVFQYTVQTPPAGSVFVASNVGGTTSVPYGAFGSTTYPTTAFSESAIDVTANTGGTSPGFQFSTILVATRASQSNNAALKDLVTPLPVAFSTTSVGDAGDPHDIALEPASPNPAAGPIHLRFSLMGSARVRLGVFDLAGRRVATLADGAYGAGWHSVEWSGASDHGARRAGVYFVRGEIGSRVLSRRVVVLEP